MEDIEVRESPIEGLGVFAARDFGPGERIHRVNVVREVTEDAPLQEELGEFLRHCSYPNGKIVLWGHPDRHVNHSCDPNAYELHEGDAIWIAARRGIESGQEITFDYNVAVSGGTGWPCHCGAARCLGECAGDFFRLPEDRQIEYLPLLADWFIARHAERIERLRAKASQAPR